MAKYTPLQNYLSNLAPQKDITLTFEQIERILRQRLPPSAFLYSAWWANEQDGNHVEAHAWLSAGWRVDTVDLAKKWVRFVRK